MTSMIMRGGRKIPPLNPMRVFEAVARHLSFTRAADELCVTQGAISRSVKTLEDYLGEPLFDRTSRGLVLTQRSEVLATKLSSSFFGIANAADEFRGIHTSQTLTIGADTSFMIGFLIPNLPDFQMRHPDIRIRLISATEGTVLAPESADVRVRYGLQSCENADASLLFCDMLRPLASPLLLDPARRPYPIEELRHHALLHQETGQADWSSWLSMVGRPELQPRNNLVFDELSVAYQAALAGTGLVMAQCTYFQRELASGYLFEPFGAILKRDRGLYLMVPRNRQDVPHVKLFKRWLIDAARKAANAHHPVLQPGFEARFAPTAGHRTKLVA